MLGLHKTSKLIAPLVCSCLLHTVVISFPYVFSAAHEDIPAAQERKEYTASITGAPTQTKKAGHSVHVFSEATDNGSSGTEGSEGLSDLEDLPRHYSDDKEESIPSTDTHYFRSGELTLSPRPLSEIILDIPEPDDEQEIGTLVMSLWINELGEITRATVETENIPEAYANAVIAAFKKTRFSPGELYGKRVASVMRIEVLRTDNFIDSPDQP